MQRFPRLIRRLSPTFAILALLLLLPMIAFWQQTAGGRTLLPAENLYQYEPYASYREQTGALTAPPEIPHNALVSDLVLQNMQWKAFILESIGEGEFPLWNPHQFSGIPFLAAGQHSALYPFNLIYYVLPLSAAYGWFTVSQLWLAGAFMFAFLRGLGLRREGALAGAVTYQLSAYFIISAVFPMIIAASVWLPLILLMIEFVIQRRAWLKGRRATAPWVVVGAVALGCCTLAGHVEILYYTLIIAGYYAACRLAWGLWATRHHPDRRAGLRTLGISAGWLLAMIVLGVTLGGVQFIPTFELANVNFRSGSASLDEVRGWAHPLRDVVQFVLPNFYGSPAQHSYLDVFTGANVSLTDQVVTTVSGARITNTEWGIKNYVEGALYVGLLPLALSLYALLVKRIPRARHVPEDAPPEAISASTPPYRPIFAALALLALTFMFGLPTYALLFYAFPGINQLHSPFRWVFALTLCVAALAGFGMDALRGLFDADAPHRNRRLARIFGWVMALTGAATLLSLIVMRATWPSAEPLFAQLLGSMAKADQAFSDARMFFSVQAVNIGVFGGVMLASGVLFLWASFRHRPTFAEAAAVQRRITVPNAWTLLAVALLAADLLIASAGFNAASDPAWLDYEPPAIAWMRAQPGEWRYITVDDPTQRPLLNANMTMRYGLDDARGYESIIPKQTVDFMAALAPQVQLDYNRIAPLYTTYGDGFDVRTALESPLLDALNIRYIVTHLSTDLSDIPDLQRAYSDDAVIIWENVNAYPRAMVVSGDERTAVERTGGTAREHFYTIRTEQPAELVISETFIPGWRAYSLPADTTDSELDETLLDVHLTGGNFIGVTLPDAGDWTVRLVYSPQTFQIGLFASFIAFIILMLIGGTYVWQLVIVGTADGGAGSLSRVARNSVAPILLNLFNRGIDFAFAFVMLRLLGPDEAGAYFYAGVIFVWFDIFTNFGLNLFLTREVARDHSKARTYFFNTSALRIGLAVLGIPMLAGFLGVRQTAVSPPLDPMIVVSIALLYVGLLPSSLSNGLTALFYAYERAETPAMVATIATISKTVGGLAALLLGYGIVGLAFVSIITNCITLVVLWLNGRAMLGEGPIPRPDRALMRRMAGASWPLMLNHFLQTIFFQIDVILIEAFHGVGMVGQYQIAYKWVMALNIIPAFFTQAMLPLMSRQAHDDKEALRRNYVLAIKLLVSVALPCAVLVTFMAYILTALLGGVQYLPDGAIATQIMIWSIPIGWMNSFGQYMLIALDLQRRITWAFGLAVGFNLISNFLLIPQYGYQAAAFTTILSEAVLFVPFYLLLRPAIGTVPWVHILWRPLVATAGMIAIMAVTWPLHPLIALVAGIGGYGVVWYGLRTLDEGEWARLSPLIPRSLRARLVPGVR